ncbi:hypothetical protein TNCV_1494711 [Trichonephila clavipes]|nr:hypothetical protein TNCV_1494711 [Trichonephila clavipes]
MSCANTSTRSSYSPDLSPTVYVWDKIKQDLPSYHGIRDLESIVQQAWVNLRIISGGNSTQYLIVLVSVFQPMGGKPYKKTDPINRPLAASLVTATLIL